MAVQTPEERITELKAEIAVLLEKSIARDMQFAEMAEILNEKTALETALRMELDRLGK